jgi:hypothetical protein
MANTETTVVEEPTSATSTVEQSPATAGLTIQDLIVVTKLVQLGSERSAFTPEEMPDVVTVYNKLIAFLSSVGAIGEQPVPQETAETEKQDD